MFITYLINMIDVNMDMMNSVAKLSLNQRIKNTNSWERKGFIPVKLESGGFMERTEKSRQKRLKRKKKV